MTYDSQAEFLAAEGQRKGSGRASRRWSNVSIAEIE